MFVAEDEDACLTNIDYCSHYPIEVEKENMATLDSAHNCLVRNENPNALSNYHSIENLNDLLKHKGEGDIFALHLNAVSLLAHFDEIDSLISAKTSVFPEIYSFQKPG